MNIVEKFFVQNNIPNRSKTDALLVLSISLDRNKIMVWCPITTQVNLIDLRHTSTFGM